MCFGGVSALFVDIRKRLLGGPSHMAAGLVRVAPFPILLHAYDMKGSEGWPDPWIAHPEWETLKLLAPGVRPVQLCHCGHTLGRPRWRGFDESADGGYFSLSHRHIQLK